MTNIAQPTEKAKWPKVTPENPCIECSTHKRGCTRSVDGGAWHCHKTGQTYRNASANATRPRKPDPKPTPPKRTFVSAEAAIKAAAKHIHDAKLAATSTYPGDVARVARFDLDDGSKQFRPVHKTENGAWAIGDPAGLWPLYRGDELPVDGLIYVVEGEKCADAAQAIGLAAATSAHGAKSAKKTEWTPLAGREAIILPDADAAGKQYADDVMRILHRLGYRVKIVRLPGLSDGGDIADFISAGGTREQIIALVDAEPFIEPPAMDELSKKIETDDGEEKEERFSQSQILVKLAEAVEFWHCDDVAFATIIVDDHAENYPVNGKAFRQWLSRRFYKATEKAPAAQAMQDALGVLAGKAMFDGEQCAIAVRIAEHDGAIFIDLANEKWQAIRVTSDRWEVVNDPPVRFIRRRGMQPLPLPVSGGSIDELRPLINVPDESTWILMIAFIIGAMRPRGPYAALGINGEQGSAKSTACRMLRRLIDPNEADLRATPKDERDLMIAATNAWIVAFDNLSSIKPDTSDALCRLATGGGFAMRELYSDDAEKLFSAARPILFNGIEELASRPDLLERSIILNLPTIPDERRMSEVDLWRRYELARPRILGALLDAVATAIKKLPSVKLVKRPRMADFAEWVVAAEPALPWKASEFLAAYAGNRETLVESAIEASAIGPAILEFMVVDSRWTGTAKELLAALEQDAYTDIKTRNRQDWPKTPKATANAVRRIAPALRRLSIQASFGFAGKSHSRIIILERWEVTPSAPSAPSANGDSEAPEHFPADDGGRWQTVADDGQTVEKTHRPPKTLTNAESADDADGADGRNHTRSTREKVAL